MNRNKMLQFMEKFYLMLVLLVVVVFFSAASPVFFTANNLTNIFVQNAYMVIVTLGAMLIMISGGADMSIAFQIGLNACLMGKFMSAGVPTGAVVLIGLLCGAAMGALNGVATVYLKVHPMVATLATMTIYQGLAYVISGALTFSGFPETFKIFGQKYIGGILPVSVVIMVVMIVICWFMLRYTHVGRYIYAIGGNEEAARLAGVNTKRLRIRIFIMSGVFGAVGTIVFTSRMGSASPTLASDAMFTALSASILGGVSFRGGEGNPWKVVVAVFIYGVLANGMQLIGLSIYSQYVVKGIILVAAIAFDNYQKANRVKKAVRQAAEAEDK